MIEGTRGPSSDLVGLPVGSEVEDESLAAAARARFRTDGMVGIEPDHQMRLALRPDEQLLAVRQAAGVERLIDGVRSMLSGPLAITNDRLLVVDGQAVTLASFDELDDVTLVTDRLLVMLTTGVGLTIDAVNPRLLRVELAAARARWSDGQVAAPANDGSELEADQPRR
jgi:hypothetical protein